MNTNVKRTLLVVSVVFFVSMLLIYGHRDAQKRSRPAFKILGDNRVKFSEVFVLLDGTYSMSDSDFANAKKIVKERILKTLGVNDTAATFALDGKFQDSKSPVFYLPNEQPFQLSRRETQEILKLLKTKGDINEEAFNLLRQVKARQSDADAKQMEWQSKLNSLGRPALDGSDYVAALEGIVRQLDHYKREPGKETWLFVVGDLKNESRTKRDAYAADAAFEKFNHILLVHPFNSNDPAWPATEKFWKDYFGDIRYETHTFASALGQESLIKPNPISGLETIGGENYLSVFRPWLIASVVVCLVGAFLLIMVGRLAHKPVVAPASTRV